jgi:glycine oxidase
MRADVLIVGQGIAGTLLAWECERAGISFAIADPGPATAATSIAAGLINPIAGRRLAKPFRCDTLLPLARGVYRELEVALGVPLWVDVQIRRWLADDCERRIAREKHARGELAPYVAADGVDDKMVTIHGAARIDLPTLLRVARARWQAQGKLRPSEADFAAEAERHGVAIDCRGFAGARSGSFGFVPWEFSKGEVLEIAVDGLAADTVLHRGHAMVPLAGQRAWVGATHAPGLTDFAPSLSARTALEGSASLALGRSFTTIAQRAAVRVNLPDRLPVAGRHPAHDRLGVINGLGAKGALFAPLLARLWVNHLTGSAPFDGEIDVRRFWPRNSSHASSQ